MGFIYIQNKIALPKSNPYLYFNVKRHHTPILLKILVKSSDHISSLDIK